MTVKAIGKTRLAESMARGIGDAEFNAIAALVRDKTGISLNQSKRELVTGRVSRRLRALGLDEYSHYIDYLTGPAGAAEMPEMVNAITTNLTSFFREPHHFSYLAENILMPMARRGGEHRMRIWSAACSSGEEAYSAAMVLHRVLGFSRVRAGHWDARILATDIDSNMIAQAKQGEYDGACLKNFRAEYREFLVPGASGALRVHDRIRKYVTFKQLNLLDRWPMRGLFDVVFCRNVVIYFDKELQRVLFERIANLLAVEGILFIGHSESLFRVSDRFENLGRTVYRKIR